MSRKKLDLRPNRMLCSSCTINRLTIARNLDLSKYNIHGNIFRLDCSFCNIFIAIQLNSEILNFDQCTDENNQSCWKEVTTLRDKIIYFTLGQILYPERDTPNPNKSESVYDFADDNDRIMLRWEQGKAVGFYTIKPKGSRIFPTYQEYVMPMVDTAYVRSEYRKRGIGIEILQHVRQTHPNDDIGFSLPISDGMRKGF